MRVNSNLAVVIDSDLPGETQRAGMANSPVMYRHLVDTLYTNKPDAIVRELIANMMDGHVARGNTDQPFKVIGPTKFDPCITFEDYGTGMTHEQVMTNFMMLGSSTKQDSDTAIGGFGLGCKVPLSYTDQYEVGSRQGDIAHDYIVYWDNSGWPSVTHLGSRELEDEDWGLTIRIPVAEKDFEAFNDAIRKRAWRFDPQPVCNLELHKPETLIDHDLFTLRRKTYGGDNAAYAVMGKIAYKLDAYALGYNSCDKGFKLLQNPVDIFFDIGELRPALNREGLSYTEDTVAAIKTKVALILEAVEKQLQDAIANAPNRWEAIKLWRTEVDSTLRDLCVTEKILFNGEHIDNYLRIRGAGWNVCTFTDTKSKGRAKLRFNWGTSADVDPTAGWTFLFWPEGLGETSAGRRLQEWGIERHRNNILIIKEDASLIDQLGGAAFDFTIDDATMPEPPKKKRTRDGYSRPKLAKFHRRVNRSYQEHEVDQNDGGIYTIVRNWEPEAPDGLPTIGIDTLNTWTDKFLGEPLICIPATYKTTPKKFPGWKSAHKLLKEKAIALSKDPVLAKAMAATAILEECEKLDQGGGRYAHTNPVYQFARDLDSNYPELLPKLKARTPMARVLKEYQRLLGMASAIEISWALSLIRTFQLEPKPDQRIKSTLPSLIRRAHEDHTLIKTYGNTRNVSMTDWVDYLNKF